jgi:hypothetical protein
MLRAVIAGYAVISVLVIATYAAIGVTLHGVGQAFTVVNLVTAIAVCSRVGECGMRSAGVGNACETYV